MTTQQDVVSAWKSVLKTTDEVHAYLQSASFFSNRKVFDGLVQKSEHAYAEYVRVLTNFVNKSK